MLDGLVDPAEFHFDIVPWLPLIAGIAIAAVAGIWTVVNRRGGERFASRTTLPPTWPQMWTRMDELEKRMNDRDAAFASILNDAAEQWPQDRVGPVFNKADLDVLGDTVPSKWMRRIRPSQ